MEKAFTLQTEVSVMSHLAEIFEQVPDAHRGRIFIWLGHRLGILPDVLVRNRDQPGVPGFPGLPPGIQFPPFLFHPPEEPG